MSVSFPLNQLTNFQKRVIRDITVKPKKTIFNETPVTKNVYQYDDNIIQLPLTKWNIVYDEFPNIKDLFEERKLKFKGKLFTAETDPKNKKRDQDVVAKQALNMIIENHTTLLGCHTGFGKTCLASYIITELKMKSVVLCHIDGLKVQWKESLEAFTNCKVKIVTKKSHLLEDADVYIIGVMKASKFTKDDFIDIGLVIVDEIHLVTELIFTNVLFLFEPYGLVGLSATPDRKDGLGKLFDIYFGDNKIYRREVKNFTVVKYQTHYCPDIVYKFYKGTMIYDWTKMINQMSNMKDRWKTVGDICIDHPDEKIVILCDRNNFAKGVCEYLIRQGENVELFIGSKKNRDKDKRILITGQKKFGTGTDDPSLTMMILACDTKDARQLEGRIRTNDNLIYDIVDDFPTFQKHWDKRRVWYKKRGAVIENGGAFDIDNLSEEEEESFLDGEDLKF